jgi:hypothetical protein
MALMRGSIRGSAGDFRDHARYSFPEFLLTLFADEEGRGEPSVTAEAFDFLPFPLDNEIFQELRDFCNYRKFAAS